MPEQNVSPCCKANKFRIGEVVGSVRRIAECAVQIVFGAEQQGWDKRMFEIVTRNRRGKVAVVPHSIGPLRDWQQMLDSLKGCFLFAG